MFLRASASLKTRRRSQRRSLMSDVDCTLPFATRHTTFHLSQIVFGWSAHAGSSGRTASVLWCASFLFHQATFKWSMFEWSRHIKATPAQKCKRLGNPWIRWLPSHPTRDEANCWRQRIGQGLYILVKLSVHDSSVGFAKNYEGIFFLIHRSNHVMDFMSQLGIWIYICHSIINNYRNWKSNTSSRIVTKRCH